MIDMGWGRVAGMVLLIGSLAAAACSTPRASRVDAGDEPVASLADPDGRMRGYAFARKYQDVVKIDGKNVQQTVEYGYDYDRRSAVRRISDASGALMSEELLPTESLRANERESARLVELVRTHPQLGPLMQQPDLHIHTGGFVVREPGDRYCDVGSRCLRVIVSSGDGSTRVLHAVVDLVRDRVVYPFYDDSTPVQTK